MNKRILVAGGAGFMGSWISHRLKMLGYHVFILDNFAVGTYDNIPLGVDYMSGDAADISVVQTAFRFFKPDVVYNLAAFAREGTSSLSPISCVKNNIDIHVNLITEMIKAGSEKMVYFSSESVYGMGKPPFDESTPRNPCDPYGSAKAFCEEFTESMSKVHGFDYTIIRPHNVFGPRQSLRDRGRNVIAIFINQTMRGEPITVYGDGTCRRAFSFIDNSLPCYINALDGHHGETFNVGDKKAVTINYVAKTVQEAMASCSWRKSDIIHIESRPLEIQDGFATTKKQIDLGYKEIVSFEEGVHLMARWATERGPQEWLNNPMELPVDGMPRSWR